MTFEPHPREFFMQLAGTPEQAPQRIANLRDKLGSLSDAGIDRVIVEHFNRSFAAISPEQFIEKILIQSLHMRWLLVGQDFCFGARRAGNIDTLIAAGKQYGFEVVTMPNVNHAGVRISSSVIRSALAKADFVQARQLLGHSYTISGHVIHGRKLGRSIGFPTLNMRVGHQQTALSGIFMVLVHGLSAHPLPAVASLGARPTIDDSGRILLETHVFDYSGDCYGKLLRVEFLQKIRNEEKYVDLPTLTAAIERDVQQTRTWFQQQTSFAVSATDRI